MRFEEHWSLFCSKDHLLRFQSLKLCCLNWSSLSLCNLQKCICTGFLLLRFRNQYIFKYNAGVFPLQRFIKKTFSHAKKLKDTLFLDLITFFPYLLYSYVYVDVSFAKLLENVADIVMLVCYFSVHLLKITTLFPLKKLTRIS